MAISPYAEIILKKCQSPEAFATLSDEEKNVLRNVAKGSSRLMCDNSFLGRKKPTEKEEGVKFYTFSLPRILSCPGSTTICQMRCYQRTPEEMLKQSNRDSAVVNSRKLNLFLSLQSDFVNRISDEIKRKKPAFNEKLIVRIHPSGDFYSTDYFKKWLKIALVTRLYGKQYDFVAYTKSFSIIDEVLGDQGCLKTLYQEAYEAAKVGLVQKDELKFSDFNINIIASYMDDTSDEAKYIAHKWSLPVYYATENNEPGLEDCEGKPCANCMKCYQFPMKDVTTKLR